MSDTAAFVAIAVVALGVLALLAILPWHRGGEQRLSPLAGLALGCVVTGIVFGENRVVGYGLFAAGIILAIVDSVRRSRGSGSSGPGSGR
jgi:hypothetical protein